MTLFEPFAEARRWAEKKMRIVSEFMWRTASECGAPLPSRDRQGAVAVQYL
jgi:hypothetical protein